MKLELELGSHHIENMWSQCILQVPCQLDTNQPGRWLSRSWRVDKSIYSMEYIVKNVFALRVGYFTSLGRLSSKRSNRLAFHSVMWLINFCRSSPFALCAILSRIFSHTDTQHVIPSLSWEMCLQRKTLFQNHGNIYPVYISSRSRLQTTQSLRMRYALYLEVKGECYLGHLKREVQTRVHYRALAYGWPSPQYQDISGLVQGFFLATCTQLMPLMSGER